MSRERTDAEPPDASTHGRAGRDLVAAVGVGTLLGAVVVASLVVHKAFFVVVAVAVVALAVYELAVALRPAGVRLPLGPLLLGVGCMLVGTYAGGTAGLTAALGCTAAAVCGWRLFRGGREGFVRDVSAALFVVLYLPFLASFAILLLRPADGASRVLCLLLVTVASDVGGYVAGVLFGRHPMAPAVSPKKSWEGLVGSTVFCLGAGVPAVVVTLDGPWWAGAALALAGMAAATVGDLFESMLKRDVGIKDMGSFLPGHGGMMDRIDSLLTTALVSWLVLTVLVPPPG